MTIIFALRSINVGVDTVNYTSAYEKVITSSFKELVNNRMEVGFIFFIKFLSLISPNPQFMIVITSLIITSSVFYAIKKYSKDRYMSIMLFILLMFMMSFMNIMRQALSISIIIYSLKYIIENKKIKAILIILLAALFHKVGLLFLPLVFLYNIKINYKVMISVILMSFVVFILFYPISNILVKIIPEFKNYLGTIHGQSNYFGALLDYMFFLLIFTILTVCLKKSESRIQNLLLWIFSIQMFFQVLVIRMTILSRISNLYAIFIILLIPSVLEKTNGTERKLIKAFLYVISFAYFLTIAIFRPEWNGAIPYEFFWNS